MKAYIQKTLKGWKPADEQSEKYWKKGKLGDYYQLEISKPRNGGYHRMYFAMLKIVFDNQEIYRSQNELLDAIKFGVGHVETRKKLTGEFYQKPASISFANMEQDKFEDFFNRSVNVVLEHILPGTTRDEIVNEVLAMAA